MDYGILVQKHNGHEIYQNGDKFYVVTKSGCLIGTSNSIEGACIVASLGKSGCDDLFKKKRGRK